MAISLPSDFQEFLKLLNAKKVKYLVIGGYAVGYHGYPRATKDLDVFVASDPENAKKLVAVLRKFGFGSPDLSPELFLQDKIVRMGVPPIRLELTTNISGVSFDECYASRVVAVLDGVRVSLISLPKLKQNKKASGRHKDLDDLEHLP
ncbi:MAG: nucleotidyltransferase [Chloroflexi bacterium]|nr:nucleotidyltransferase [Chloroflexota bacterium]